MVHDHPSSSVLTVSPPDSNFTPRKEFQKQSTRPPSSFALLALASTGLVRLSSFPPNVVTALRRELEKRQLIRGIREDTNLNLTEFSVDGKPWNASKNIDSESIFVAILAVILQHGFTFLTTIDYGREQDERLSIAFSKPATPPPVPLTGYYSPFGLSFPSATVLRVIDPPLRSTPAILQGVRSAWPRGVVSERKVGSGCYEFKLKGYKWFQDDTFATDSLRHILSLLNSLDAHSFTLLTSVSLSGSRSRVKDLWIFIGPQDDSPIASSEGSNFEMVRTQSPFSPGSPDSSGSRPSGEANHGRNASAPAGSSLHPQLSGQSTHTRAQTDPNASRTSSAQGNVLAQSLLRKKSPKPRQSDEAAHPSPSPKQQHTPLPGPHPLSIVDDNISSVGSVDMTGVGTRGEIYVTPTQGLSSERNHPYNVVPPSRAGRQPSPEILYTTPSPRETQTHAMESRERGSRKSPPPHITDMPIPPSEISEYATAPNTISSDETHRLPPDVPRSVYGYGPIENDATTIKGNEEPATTPTTTKASSINPTPPLLGGDAFRDSAFSSSTAQSYEVPITWTGSVSDGRGNNLSSIHEAQSIPFNEHALIEEVRRSTPLELPGAWQPTPPEEKTAEAGALRARAPSPLAQIAEHATVAASSDPAHLPDRKDVKARVASPTVSEQGEGGGRKSEVAAIGIMSGMAKEGKPEAQPQSVAKRNGNEEPTANGNGKGWVLVSVEGTGTPVSEVDKTFPPATTLSPPSLATTPEEEPPLAVSSMSPMAKAVAAADAKQSTTTSTSSPIKRFFSRSKKNSANANVPSVNEKGKGSLKARKRGTVEVAKPTDKRVSIN
ncbi:hypothetical protein BD410DRAFT_863039 [Rickenella mellea]|uniref:Uncharacterized protein n=1 Tax=Rickenella mellea TaxID=50990 RepID=A0A4Y7QLY9_9AGAM|nr:hypothetical protein BD410DRAFT_863039 [Rickenella mellea]